MPLTYLDHEEERLEAGLCAGFNWPAALVHGSDAMRALVAAEMARPGTIPVLLGPPAVASQIWQASHRRRTQPSAILTRSASRKAQLRISQLRGLPDAAPDGPQEDKVHLPVKMPLISAMRFGGGYQEKLVLAWIGCARSSHVFAHVQLPRNDLALPPHVHVAMEEDWLRRYHARPVSIGINLIEYVLARPPGDRQSTEALGRQIVALCPDMARLHADLHAYLRGAPTMMIWWP